MHAPGRCDGVRLVLPAAEPRAPGAAGLPPAWSRRAAAVPPARGHRRQARRQRAAPTHLVTQHGRLGSDGQRVRRLGQLSRLIRYDLHTGPSAVQGGLGHLRMQDRMHQFCVWERMHLRHGDAPPRSPRRRQTPSSRRQVHRATPASPSPRNAQAGRRQETHVVEFQFLKAGLALQRLGHPGAKVWAGDQPDSCPTVFQGPRLREAHGPNLQRLSSRWGARVRGMLGVLIWGACSHSASPVKHAHALGVNKGEGAPQPHHARC